jgi:hypothetical protein
MPSKPMLVATRAHSALNARGPGLRRGTTRQHVALLRRDFNLSQSEEE